jgi:hypothetical protein
VFQRDGYRCVGCGFQSSPETAETELDAHHITDRTEMPNGGYVKENGISLCKIGASNCHARAEMFHSSGKSEWESGFHPDDLYRKIGSTYEVAVRASKKLCEADGG